MKIAIDLKSGQIAERNKKDIIFGIDLGTTNSLIAYIQDGQPKTIKSETGKNSLVPSVIHFDSESQLIVGDKAKEYLISDPSRTIYSVKRLMGKSYEDVQNWENTVGYKIIQEDNNELAKVKIDKHYYSPIELSAEILKELKHIAQKNTGQNVVKVVITVPAYFNDAQRQATRDAGKLAGLDVLRVINEPTAASLAYGIGLDKNQSQTVAVYDLGGGTFDISILSIEDGIFEVLSTHGDTFLGGDDFDNAVIFYWCKVFGIHINDLQQDLSLNQEFRLMAEKSKVALSSNETFQSYLNGRNYELDRVTFESLTEHLVERTIDSCRKALSDAGLTADKLDHVILVGGSTRIPLVKNRIQDFFGMVPYDKLDPDEVVALGAAIQADILAGNRNDLLLLDITPLSLGIETVGGLMDTIIPRNSKVPMSAARQYTTSVDGQKNLKISVFQGERDLVEFNRKLGEFILKNIPSMPAGLPKIEVKFILDADGILTVKAKELRSDIETQIEIKSTYGVSEEEMALMLLDSIKNAERDMQMKALLEAINEAQSIILASEKFIVQNVDILSENEISEIKRLSDVLKYMVSQNSKDLIHEAMENLNTYTTPLAEKALDVQISQALKGRVL